jgi:thioredoxin-related protein
MKGLLYILILFEVTTAFAQEQEQSGDKGILFQTTLSWEQVQAKAKAENKYIFVDCYASWCGPCKQMDRDTYPQDSVGSYFNSHFVSVKVQMDTSGKDDPRIASWYLAAHYLQTIYKVYAFPTFLFFSPNGDLVHRGLGFHDAGELVTLGKTATDSTRQYYTLLERYKKGERDYIMMEYLAIEADIGSDTALADAIAREYLNNHVYKETDSVLLTKPNLEFLSTFYRILTSKERLFQLLLRQGPAADDRMWKGWAESVVDFVITKEEVDPFLTSENIGGGRRPDWSKLNKRIAEKYQQSYAERITLIARINWYEERKEWSMFTKTVADRMGLIERKELTPNALGISYDLNLSAWLIFLYSGNDRELRQGITWVKKAIQLRPDDPQYYDTYANLLYKLRLNTRALALEEKAVRMGKDLSDVRQNYEKMKAGGRTWVYPDK